MHRRMAAKTVSRVKNCLTRLSESTFLATNRVINKLCIANFPDYLGKDNGVVPLSYILFIYGSGSPSVERAIGEI